ncbi:MAG: FecR domain-containing protein [Bythopirellula sp.]|nr:FecR domain-containing protein [Bythopirellula sp.]
MAKLAANNNPSLPSDRIPSLSAQVARVNSVSANAHWINPNESYTVHSVIRVGDKLSLAQGEIELVYETGVKLLLIGPADFVLRSGGGELRRGGLMASVPKVGHGFKIETPNGTVIDLGTQFGVVVDDFGVSEVSVFEGKVEAFPSRTAGSREGKFELSQGRALQWSNEMLKPLKADARRLPFSLASFSRSDIDELPSNAAQSTGLQIDSVDAKQWKILGDVRPAAGGFVFGGDRQLAAQPYLIASEQLDPTNGPVTIICDLRFPHLTPRDEPSFSILTRSEDERTKMNRPWKNVLATCVRCNFRAATDALDGLLETATKYERDRELTGISWGGFVRPEENTLYRLVMRDDGVNVSFTVSQVHNPSVSKTVTCRSLFRGYENHVALEGWDEGMTIVDRVRVFQEAPAGSLANHFPNLRGSEKNRLSTDTVTDTDKQSNLLNDLVPTNARLVVEDNFNHETINATFWKSLGDVIQDQGSVSLGKSSTSNHIDTFHPRPYLLTRRQFKPAEGKLYVLGRIEFDKNFLHGYGGSFAVLTRSDDEYGVGPEWAISALSTGVRSNFWPAATRQDHLLEIHEKPTANTLSFLSGASLEIKPESRAYNFCLADDGQTVALTIQDRAHPTIRRTLQQPTKSQLLQSGFIGFESCWGSRVLLDDVRIYVQPPAAPPQD